MPLNRPLLGFIWLITGCKRLEKNAINYIYMHKY